MLKFAFLFTLLSGLSFTPIALADLDPDNYYDFNEDYENSFRCEIVVIVVNLNNRFETQRQSFFGSGRSWNDSRSNAFNLYGRWISGRSFWRNNHSHRFYFNNCFGDSGSGGPY